MGKKNVVADDVGFDEEAADDAPPAAPPLDEGFAPKAPTELFHFKIPKSARRKASDPVAVVLRELTFSDMIDATKGAGAKVNAQTAMIAASLWKVDLGEGLRRVRHSDDEGVLIWGRCSAKVRVLIRLGWEKIHLTTDEEDEAFLSSIEPVAD